MKKQLIQWMAVGTLALTAVACQSKPTAQPPAPPKTDCPSGDNSCSTSKTDAAKPVAPETKTSAAPKAAAPAIVQQPAPAAPAILVPEKAATATKS